MAVVSSVEKVRVQLAADVQYVVADTKNEYTNYKGELCKYDDVSIDLEGLEDGIAGLAQLALILKNLPEDGVDDMDYDEAFERLREWAADLAESAEVPFTFEDRDGDVSTYTPASLWESSGGCEWVTSAQEGYDFGWDI